MTGVRTPRTVLYMTTNRNFIPAEITMTATDGKVFCHVNGAQIIVTRDGGAFVQRIERALRAARVYRETGYHVKGEAMIAEGRQVVA